jgi:GTP-binding protein
VIRRADIVLLVLDLTEQIGHQDKALADLSLVANRGIILVINKIDLEPKFDEKLNKFIAYYQGMLANISWAPIIFVSAKTEQNVDKIFDLIWQVKENRERKIENNELGDFLAAIIKNKKFDQKIWSKISLRQVGIKPPRFVLNVPKLIVKRKLIHQAQLNIIEKELRKKWSFEGTVIKIITQTQ